jgi:nucleolar MIF4G domain-containing protein 1
MRDSGKSLQRTANLEKLQKTLQGLVNRLNESNIQSICTQLEQMYTRNSRNDMNSCLTEVLLKACVSPALLSERFAMLHAMLVAILHSNIGSEVGAYVVQTLAQKLDSLLSQSPNYGRGKECDCVMLLMASLYNFKVIHCVLVYDIIRKLMESFTERDVELLLLLLKNTGMEIRRDDATSLKDIVLQIQSKAASSNLSDSSRVRFMLDTINALKTNNSRKIPNYDPSLLDHMRRLLRGLVRSKGPADENQLKISLKDLLLTRQQAFRSSLLPYIAD